MDGTVEADGTLVTLIGEVSATAYVWHELGRIRVAVGPDPFDASPDQLEDGDLYSVAMRSATGTILATDEWTVQYREHYPNGEDCDGFCEQAHFETQGL